MSVNSVNSYILFQQISFFSTMIISGHPRVIRVSLFSGRPSLFCKLASILAPGYKKQGCLHSTARSPLTQRLRPFRSSVFTTSICCLRRIRSQLSRPLRKGICRIPLAFPQATGLSIQMSAFSFLSVDFAQQKYDSV